MARLGTISTPNRTSHDNSGKLFAGLWTESYECDPSLRIVGSSQGCSMGFHIVTILWVTILWSV